MHAPWNDDILILSIGERAFTVQPDHLLSAWRVALYWGGVVGGKGAGVRIVDYPSSFSQSERHNLYSARKARGVAAMVNSQVEA